MCCNHYNAEKHQKYARDCGFKRHFAHTMYKEEVSLIPGFTMPARPPSGKLLTPPRTRFLKMGPNAEHPKTVQMREIKEKLRLTTVQLVAELNAYEKVHQSKNFRRSVDGSPSWHKIGSVLMSSYLQGWVMQEEFIGLMATRLNNLYKFKKEQGQLAPKADIQTIMNREANFYSTTDYRKWDRVLQLSLGFRLNDAGKKVKTTKTDYGEKEF